MIRKRLSKCVLGLVVINCCFYSIILLFKFYPFYFGEAWQKKRELSSLGQKLFENAGSGAKG